MNNKKQIIAVIAFSVFFIHALSATHAQVYSSSFISFRDTVYLQSRGLLDIMRLYTAAKQDIENTLTGENMYLALARCEYLMGITYKAESKNKEAAAFFEQGIAWSENSLAITPTSEGYLLMGNGITFLCQINTSYGLKNHGKIEENAKKALELDPDNIMANHMMATFYLFAPWPLGNEQKGERMLREILKQDYLSLNKDDLFNLYLMLQAACLKQKKNQEAQTWQQKGAELYPTNKFIIMLMS